MPGWFKWGISLLVGLGLVWVGWRVMALLVTLHIAVCFVLIIVIMLQSGNAADLAGAFGGAGSQTAFGPRGAATFLSKATTWCAVVFMMTSLALAVKRAPTESGSTGSVLEETQQSAPAPAKPAAPPVKGPAPASNAPASTPSGTPAQPQSQQQPPAPKK